MATFTLTGTFQHQDGTTPIVGSEILVYALPFPAPSSSVILTGREKKATDGSGSVSFTLTTGVTGLWYVVKSLARKPLFPAVKFQAPAAGTTLDIQSLVAYDPGAYTPTLVQQAQQARDAAQSAAASVAYSTWQASTAYVAGQTVQAPDGSLIKSTTARTSGTAFDATEQGFWTVVSGTSGTLEQVALGQTYVGSAVTQVNVKHPKYGAKGDGTTDDTSAIAAARTDAKAAKRALYFPAGTYNITGDLTIDWDDATVYGHSSGAVLAFTNGGLVVDGTATGYRSRSNVSNLQITRAGTAGPAWWLKGAGAGTGVTRWCFTNIRVESSTGDALQISGCYNGEFIGCYLRNASGLGLNIGLDTGPATVGTYAARFFGGEIQQNAKAGVITSATLIDFYGTAIEGNQQGLEIAGLTRLVNFFGCYFEANGTTGTASTTYDLAVGTGTSNGTGPVVTGCWFADGSIGKTKSILLNRCNGVEIAHNYFAGYGANPPISVQEAASGSVSGTQWNNQTNGTAAILNLNGSTTFNRAGPMAKTIESNQTITAGSIASGGTASVSVTVSGAASGDRVHVNSNGGITSGFAIADAYVSAADTVTVRIGNHSGATATPAAFTALITVFKK